MCFYFVACSVAYTVSELHWLYSSMSCSIILYVVRLVVRLEGYMVYLLRNYAWTHGDEDTITDMGGRLRSLPFFFF